LEIFMIFSSIQCFTLIIKISKDNPKTPSRFLQVDSSWECLSLCKKSGLFTNVV
jgi:hypothetical protein